MKIPPPIIYLAFFLAGIMLDRVVPVLFFTVPSAQYISWAFALTALIVVFFAVKEFLVARTSIRPDRPASSLITTGIFRITRNPLYCSLLFLYCGASIFISVWWPIILMPLLVTVMNKYVIEKEERYLLKKFGVSYRDYCERVRRWI